MLGAKIVAMSKRSGTGGGDQYTGLDRFGRVVDQRSIKTTDNSDIDRYQYGYDASSNRIWKDNLATTGKDEYYTYDMLNRLSTFDRGNLNANKTGVDNLARYQSWALDPLGNWSTFDNNGSTQTRTHNGQNQITTISGATSPAYDNNGNATTDETGNTYTFDAWNRLAGKTNSPLHYYQYDALGRLIREGELYWLMSDMYYSDRWQVVEDQRVQCRVGMIKSQYVWSVGFVDDMLLRDRNVDLTMNTGSYGKTGSGLEERVYALNDLNYNTSALVGLNGGYWAICERFIEDPYGVVTVLSPTTWAPLADSNYAWAHTHQGGWWDPSSGLLHYRNRAYSPTLGRWMQADPLLYPDGMNWYEAYLSSPVALVDPFGTMAVGNHVVPQAVTKDFTEILSEEATKVFLATYTGQTDPNHNYGTYGGVKHSEYNTLVADELKEFARQNGISKKCKLTGPQAKAFVEKIWTAGGKIGQFNRAVEKLVVGPGTIGRGKEILKQQMERGKGKGGGANAIIAGLVILGDLAISEASGENTKRIALLQKQIGQYQRAVKSEPNLDGISTDIAANVAEIFQNYIGAAMLYDTLMSVRD